MSDEATKQAEAPAPVDVLRGIRGELRGIRAALETIATIMADEAEDRRARREAEAKRNAPKQVAGSKMLDKEGGDPEVKFLPLDFQGPNFKGRRLSQTTPEFLLEYALFQDREEQAQLAKNPPNEKYATNAMFAAMKARGWAKRLREGWKPQVGGKGFIPPSPIQHQAAAENDAEEVENMDFG